MKLPSDRPSLEIVTALVAAITGSFAALGAFADTTMYNDTLTPFFEQVLGETGHVDRHLMGEYFWPALHAPTERFLKARSRGGSSADVIGEFKPIHVVTPESETTTHYFFAYS